MAEEFQIGSGNWWESSSSSTTTTTRNRFFDSGISLSSSTSMASKFNWPTDIVDIKNRSSLDSESVSESFDDEDVRRDVLSDPNLHMMGLSLNRNQTLFKGENHHHQHHHWRQTIYSEDSAVDDYGSNLESATYGSSPSNMMQGVLVSDIHNNLSYPHPYNQSNYPQFLHSSPQLRFSDNTPFWNGTAAATNDVSSRFFPSSHIQTADEKPKVTAEIRDTSSITKKIRSDTSNKRPRNEVTSPIPAFKVRKEKVGDRITALQQLVSPFGKTDTASVLSEVIEYIKFLQEQVTMLSNPYMKSGASRQHPQNFDKSKDSKQDLRSRGLCLVPVSSTSPVTNETTIDFWTPNSFGGTVLP